MVTSLTTSSIEKFTVRISTSLNNLRNSLLNNHILDREIPLHDHAITGGCQAPYTHPIPKSFWQGTRLYALLRSTKHVKMSLAYSQDFKILLESEMWSVVLRPWRKPHWVLFSFDSFAASFFKAIGNVFENSQSIADRTKGPRGPRVWDPWPRV